MGDCLDAVPCSFEGMGFLSLHLHLVLVGEKNNIVVQCLFDNMTVEVLLYVHRNRRLIRDGRPGRPPRLSHSS